MHCSGETASQSDKVTNRKLWAEVGEEEKRTPIMLFGIRVELAINVCFGCLRPLWMSDVFPYFLVHLPRTAHYGHDTRRGFEPTALIQKH